MASFLIQMILPPTMVLYLGFTPSLAFSKFWIWQLVTYAFLHGNGWHLFFNMFALWMFGPPLESIWGTKKFLLYYFICVLGAAAFQSFLAPDVLVVGASGAIYGLLLAFGLLFPDSVMYLFFIFPVRAIQAVIFISLLTLVSAIGSGGSRVAHFAHLGGMLAGFLYLRFPEWVGRVSNRSWKSAFRNPFKKPRFHVIHPTKDLTSEVDRILEKISKQGLNSLTSEEHDIMQRYARDKN
jgi:membrane associated rhomboid family serine protease